MSDDNQKIEKNSDYPCLTLANSRVTREEADRIMAVPGNIKGLFILANLDYARKKGGSRAIKKIEQRLQELGYSYNLKSIKPMEKYSDSFSVLIILLIKEIFDLSNEEVFEMGAATIRLSPLTKIMTRYFLPVETVIKQASRYWERYLDIGRLEIAEFNKEKGYAVIRLFDYQIHPTTCFYHRGYFVQVAKMSTGKKEIESKETKCIYKGDPYHEHYISWK